VKILLATPVRQTLMPYIEKTYYRSVWFLWLGFIFLGLSD